MLELLRPLREPEGNSLRLLRARGGNRRICCGGHGAITARPHSWPASFGMPHHFEAPGLESGRRKGRLPGFAFLFGMERESPIHAR